MSNLPPFIQRLQCMIEDPNTNHVISQSDDDSNSFVVKNIKLFEHILAQYFKHNKFASFVRQLNMYEFCKIRDAQHGATQSHPYFNRNQKHLLHNIRRKTTQENDNRSFAAKNEALKNINDHENRIVAIEQELRIAKDVQLRMQNKILKIEETLDKFTQVIEYFLCSGGSTTSGLGDRSTNTSNKPAALKSSSAVLKDSSKILLKSSSHQQQHQNVNGPPIKRQRENFMDFSNDYNNEKNFFNSDLKINRNNFLDKEHSSNSLLSSLNSLVYTTPPYPLLEYDKLALNKKSSDADMTSNETFNNKDRSSDNNFHCKYEDKDDYNNNSTFNEIGDSIDNNGVIEGDRKTLLTSFLPRLMDIPSNLSVDSQNFNRSLSNNVNENRSSTNENNFDHSKLSSTNNHSNSNSENLNRSQNSLSPTPDTNLLDIQTMPVEELWDSTFIEENDIGKPSDFTNIDALEIIRENELQSVSSNAQNNDSYLRKQQGRSQKYDNIKSMNNNFVTTIIKSSPKVESLPPPFLRTASSGSELFGLNRYPPPSNNPSSELTNGLPEPSIFNNNSNSDSNNCDSRFDSGNNCLENESNRKSDSLLNDQFFSTPEHRHFSIPPPPSAPIPSSNNSKNIDREIYSDDNFQRNETKTIALSSVRQLPSSSNKPVLVQPNNSNNNPILSRTFSHPTPLCQPNSNYSTTTHIPSSFNHHSNHERLSTKVLNEKFKTIRIDSSQDYGNVRQADQILQQLIQLMSSMFNMKGFSNLFPNDFHGFGCQFTDDMRLFKNSKDSNNFPSYSSSSSPTDHSSDAQGILFYGLKGS